MIQQNAWADERPSVPALFPPLFPIPDPGLHLDLKLVDHALIIHALVIKDEKSLCFRFTSGPNT